MLAYHRAAGPNCVDELFAIFPDGRVVAVEGERQLEAQVTPEEVTQLLAVISDEHGWFTNEIYDTYHNPCRQCYTHYILIVHGDQQKGATAVDGGVDMPPGYGLSLALIRTMLPDIEAAP